MERPETQYTRTPDGVSLAYHVVGDGPVDLIWLHAFMGGLEVLWEHEVVRSLTAKLTTFCRLIRHDMRATGLSGRAASLPDLETQVQDVEAVLDAVGSRSTVIFGAGPGAHAALLFGATYPERTRALCLWDIYAWAATAFLPRDLDRLVGTWGTEASAAAAMSRVAPSLVGDREFLKWFAKVQRHFLPPDGAGDLMRTAIATVIAPVLPMVHVPTLVMAREWENHQQDREISAEIDGARFALLPGTERATFAGDQDSLVGAIQDFLGVTPAAGASGTLLRAVLFTDIVGSTTNLATMGDLKWREVLVSHDERTTRAVEEHGGHVVKSTGDGVLATFEGPAQAVRAALAAADAVKNLGIEIRSGVHVGEIEMKGDDVMGVTVHVAARVAALAGASQTLVSQTVKDLVAGSGLVFQDQGTHELKGVPDSWHLYEVTR